MFTFRAVARASKFDYASLDLSGSGTVDRNEGTTRFTEIVLRLHLTLPNGADPERAQRMLEKGKNACLVTGVAFGPVKLRSCRTPLCQKNSATLAAGRRLGPDDGCVGCRSCLIEPNANSCGRLWPQGERERLCTGIWGFPPLSCSRCSWSQRVGCA